MYYILIISMIFSFFGYGCDTNKDYYRDENSFDNESLKMVEQKTGISFPDGSRGLKLFYQGSQIDPSFVAKIEIPSDVNDVMAKQIEQFRNMPGGVIGSLTEKVNWWNPTSETIQIERQFTLNGNYVHILFCREDNRFVVYIEWMKI